MFRIMDKLATRLFIDHYDFIHSGIRSWAVTFVVVWGAHNRPIAITMGGRRWGGGPPIDTLCTHKHHITHGSCPNGFVENGQSKHPRNSIGSLIPFALGTYPVYLKYNLYKD